MTTGGEYVQLKYIGRYVYTYIHTYVNRVHSISKQQAFYMAAMCPRVERQRQKSQSRPHGKQQQG